MTEIARLAIYFRSLAPNGCQPSLGRLQTALTPSRTVAVSDLVPDRQKIEPPVGDATVTDQMLTTRKPYILALSLLWGFTCVAQVNVTTYHNDNARTGQNTNETLLTPASVQSQFGKLFTLSVDGSIYAQPLYMSGLQIGGGTHNVVFVATEHDSVYAFDADSGGNPLWHVSLINPGAGVTTRPSTDTGCDDLTPEIGITGTPVIDPSSKTLYLVAVTKENGTAVQRLHALDITSGAERFGGPVAIQASAAGTGLGSIGGMIAFDPSVNNQKTGLLLQNGLVYIAWSSYCDLGTYHGWLMAYNAQTLQQAAAWSATPGGPSPTIAAGQGGIWLSGGAPSADVSGNVYLATGNGTFDLNTGGPDAANTLLKLGVPNGGGLPILDYFTPFDQGTLTVNDLDLGSGGVLLLPDLPAGSAHPQLAVNAGKEGTLYVVDRNSMGHYSSSGNSQIVQSVQLLGALFGTPAYWNGNVYVGPVNAPMAMYSVNASNPGKLSGSPVSSTPNSYYFPGTTPSISANGNSNGIVWSLQTDLYAHTGGSAVLRAHDATDLATVLYSSDAKAQDAPGPALKYSVPTVANGKVFVGTATQLAVYGLADGSSSGIVSPAPGVTLSGNSATFSWGAVSGASQYQLTVGSTQGGSDIFSGSATNTSQTVDFLPCNGGTIYVQLSAVIGGSPQSIASGSYPCKSGSGDFNGDGHQDLLWQNNTTRQVNVQYYAGSSPVAQGSGILGGPSMAGWHVVGTGDFDRNGSPDVVWQNDATGQVNVNYYSGTTYQSSATLNATGVPGWSVVGVGDMNSDGVPDLIWQNNTTKQVVVDYYGGAGGAVYQGWNYLNSIGVLGWSVVAVADFDGNGVPDLVWQNLSTRQVNVSFYGGAGGDVVLGWTWLNEAGVPGWTVVGARDFNADGIADLIWQNDMTHQIMLHFFKTQGYLSVAYQGSTSLSAGSASSQVVGVADFNGNGEPDLIWQDTSGQITINYYVLGGGVYQSWGTLNTGEAGWTLVGTGDFDGNGVPDLVWQNDNTRQEIVQYYGGPGGAVYQGWAYLNAAGVPGWTVAAVADMNGDGVPDLIWQNTTTTQVVVNYYGGAGGAVYQGWAYLEPVGAPGWKVVAAADFDGNGTTDLIWQNSTTTLVVVHYFGGAGGVVFQRWAYVDSVGAPGWKVVGAADFDGNGTPDLIWQNNSTSQVIAHYYGGTGGTVLRGWASVNPGAAGWNAVVPRSR